MNEIRWIEALPADFPLVPHCEYCLLESGIVYIQLLGELTLEQAHVWSRSVNIFIDYLTQQSCYAIVILDASYLALPALQERFRIFRELKMKTDPQIIQAYLISEHLWFHQVWRYFFPHDSVALSQDFTHVLQVAQQRKTTERSRPIEKTIQLNGLPDSVFKTEHYSHALYCLESDVYVLRMYGEILSSEQAFEHLLEQLKRISQGGKAALIVHVEHLVYTRRMMQMIRWAAAKVKMNSFSFEHTILILHHDYLRGLWNRFRHLAYLEHANISFASSEQEAHHAIQQWRQRQTEPIQSKWFLRRRSLEQALQRQRDELRKLKQNQLKALEQIEALAVHMITVPESPLLPYQSQVENQAFSELYDLFYLLHFEMNQAVLDLRQQVEHYRQAEREAQAANEAKDRFLENMSHELRTPLNAIMGFSHLFLQGKVKPNQQRHYLERVHHNAKQLLTQVNDILALEQIEGCASYLPKEDVEISSLLAALVPAFLQQAQQQNLIFECHDQGGLVWHVVRQQLLQILSHLLSNAFKFTASGYIKLFTVVDNQTQSIFVQDTGIGIAEEHFQSIFEAFHQLDGSTTKKYGGTGLGLTISQALCRQMGLRLSLESQLDKGSCFGVHYDCQMAV